MMVESLLRLQTWVGEEEFEREHIFIWQYLVANYVYGINKKYIFGLRYYENQYTMLCRFITFP